MRLFAVLALILFAIPVAAQHDDHAHDHTDHEHIGHDHSNDAGAADTPTGLTREEERGLRTGAGLGLAKAAELHQYPGPLHVLELAEPLQLTPGQLQTAQQLRSEMLFRAIQLGERIIQAERQLDALFESETATAESVSELTGTIAMLRGQLRAVHLTAHLGMRDALTVEQIAAYDQLRGYSVSAGR